MSGGGGIQGLAGPKCIMGIGKHARQNVEDGRTLECLPSCKVELRSLGRSMQRRLEAVPVRSTRNLAQQTKEK